MYVVASSNMDFNYNSKYHIKSNRVKMYPIQ